MVIAILKSQEGEEHTSLLQLLGQEIIKRNQLTWGRLSLIEY